VPLPPDGDSATPAAAPLARRLAGSRHASPAPAGAALASRAESGAV